MSIQTSEASLIVNPVVIIGSKYCSPDPVDLTVFRKVKAITDGDFVVKDVNGKIVFKVKEVHPNGHNKILLDRARNPILTLQKKVMTAHHRWQVFMGESIEPKDLIFSVKSHSMLYLKAKLDVFLAKNKTEKTCDFKIRGSYAERSSIVHAADQESTILAQMRDRKHTAPNLLLGREDCSVMVSPNVDYAFIMALMVILDQIDNEGRDYATGVSHAALPILLAS